MANPQACEIKVLMLLYSPDKRAYIGFIPNDQAGFVDRIRKVIQQQKSKQGQQGQQPAVGQAGQVGQVGPAGVTTAGVGPSGVGVGVGPQVAAAPVVAAQSGPNILVSQTNPLSMAGGQLSSAPQQQQQLITAAGGAAHAPTMAGVVRAHAPPMTQLDAERQQNLMTIKQLQQTLAAAEQKELQLKAQVLPVH